MRWLKFTAAGNTSWGLVEGDKVVTVSGDPFGEWQRTAQSHALKDVKIELPLIPRTFYCVGLNYLKHLKEAADKAGTVPNVPDRPEIGYRAQNALIAHDEDVVIPATATEKIHYEGELVVVIGKKAKHLTEANAMSCVFGYTIGNDVSRTHLAKGRSLAVALQERRHVQADGPVDRDRCRSRQDGNRDPGQRQGDRPLPHQRDDLRRRAVHRRTDQIFHAVAGRRDLDGHRRRLAGYQGTATWSRSTSPASAPCATSSWPRSA